MNADLLRTFAAVVQAGSFTRAGELLGISQPAVSATIARLERQLGYPLLVRTSRHVALTLDGAALAAECGALADAYRRSMDIIRASRAAKALHLRLGCPNFVDWPEKTRLINLFAERHAEIEFEIVYGDFPTLFARVERRELDLLLCNMLADTRLANMRELPLGRRIAHLFVPCTHSLASLDVVLPAMLEGETLLLAPGRSVPHVVDDLAARFGQWGAHVIRAPDSSRATIEHLAESRGILALRWEAGAPRRRPFGGMVAIPIQGDPVIQELRLIVPAGATSRAVDKCIALVRDGACSGGSAAVVT